MNMSVVSSSLHVTVRHYTFQCNFYVKRIEINHNCLRKGSRQIVLRNLNGVFLNPKHESALLKTICSGSTLKLFVNSFMVYKPTNEIRKYDFEYIPVFTTFILKK